MLEKIRLNRDPRVRDPKKILRLRGRLNLEFVLYAILIKRWREREIQRELIFAGV